MAPSGRAQTVLNTNYNRPTYGYIYIYKYIYVNRSYVFFFLKLNNFFFESIRFLDDATEQMHNGNKKNNNNNNNYDNNDNTYKYSMDITIYYSI